MDDNLDPRPQGIGSADHRIGLSCLAALCVLGAQAPVWAQASPGPVAPVPAEIAAPKSPSVRPQAPQTSTFAEIVVTARKRAELARSVPIAVNAFDQAGLEQLNIATLQDLQAAVPSLYVQPSTFRQDTINLALRGQQNFQSTDLSFDTATAVYVDGVYLARPVGLTGALFDLDSLQVLKGPQGTLVGRNSTGGAILYQHREPTDAFGGYVKATVGDFAHEDLQGALNIPLSDTLWFRAAFDQQGTQGYIKNFYDDPATGYRNTTPGEGDRKQAAVLSLRWRPDATFHLTLRGDVDTEHDTGATYHDLGYFVGTTPAAGNKPSICNIPGTCAGFTDLLGQTISPYYANAQTGTVSGLASAYNALLNSVAREKAEGFWSTEQAVSNYDAGHFQTVSGLAEKTQGDIDIRLSAAFRGFDTTGDAVSRGLPYDTTTYIYNTPDYTSYQSELTVNGSDLDNRLKWTAGLFFFRESSPHDGDQYYLFLPSGITPTAASGKQVTFTNSTQNSQQNTSYAGYTQATFSLTPHTRITAGVRYTEDVREAVLQTGTVRFPGSAATTASVANGVYNPAGFTLNGITYLGQTDACALTDASGVLLPPSQCRYTIEKTYRKPTWTFALDHDLGRDVLVYFTSRSGYRSGAINAASINPGVFLAQPESVQDYEIGVKSNGRLLGLPVRANLDAYYTDYTNIQIQETLPNVTVAAAASGGPCTQAIYGAGQCLGVTNDNVTLNAKSARIEGVEWDVDLRPTPALTLSTSGSYIDAVYTDFSFSPPPGYLLPVGATNLTGTHFPLPTWQVNSGAAYALPVSTLFGAPLKAARLTWRTYWQSANQASLSGYNAIQQMKGYALSNLRFDVFDLGRTRIDLSAYVTNVFDSKICVPEPQGVLNSAPNATFGVAATSGVLQCMPMAPRMSGVTMAYTF